MSEYIVVTPLLKLLHADKGKGKLPSVRRTDGADMDTGVFSSALLYWSLFAAVVH